MTTNFFNFTQNNSGGTFDVDENVCHRVIIEAIDEKHAISIFKPMIENQSGSCSCCGDRWYDGSPDLIDLDEIKKDGWETSIYVSKKESDSHIRTQWDKRYGMFPVLEKPTYKKDSFKKFSGKIYFESLEQYCQFMANEYGWTNPDIRIHYLDGNKKEIFINFKK